MSAAAGLRAAGVGERVNRGETGLLGRGGSVASKSASVSPGKPAMTSVVIATSGTCSRISANGAAVLVRSVAAAHPFEDGVRAALERQVEVRAESRVVPETEECGRDVLRLQGGEADARDGRAFEERFEEASRALLAPA